MRIEDEATSALFEDLECGHREGRFEVLSAVLRERFDETPQGCVVEDDNAVPVARKHALLQTQVHYGVLLLLPETNETVVLKAGRACPLLAMQQKTTGFIWAALRRARGQV